MFSTLVEWARIALVAFSALFDFLSQTVSEMADGTSLDWLFDFIDTLAEWISNLPVLGSIGANLWNWATTTPIIEMIIAYIPIAMLCSLITWIINIVF